jgi:murein DD-endopeptidase MepM/ murein hydrolase activator NlpD
MQGPAAEVAFVLGASSMADLSDRLEFGSAVIEADADLSTEVQNLRKELEADEAEQQRLEAQETETLGELQAELSELDEAFRQQQDAYAAIQAERSRAEDLVADLRKEWQRELSASIPPVTTGGGSSSTGPGAFQTCPVGQPHALTDSFGAPRYGGGYHLHAGVDIMAPTGTPIYATFAGTAVDSSNGLGGIAVRVIGSSGWTYNAHMSSIGQLGAVQAGDVIGYVGATGDTSTPHNHFEWHPNAIPSDWPASAYGYSVVGDAVNPYPMLVAIC